MKHLALAAIALLAATLIGACGEDTPNESAGPVEVELTEYSINMPTTVEGPVVNLDITNLGSVAHELDLAQVEPGTTLEEAAVAFGQDGPDDGVLIADPGGITAVGPGAHFGYTRTLAPGTYVLSCYFPAPDGMNHLQHGMIAVFTVTDGQKSELPTADLTITLGDDAITVPPLTAGTHVVAVTNIGTLPHEMNIGGVPIGTDLSRGEEVGAWMEGGQVGPGPIPVEFPGGLKSIAPGATVVLTVTVKSGHTYMFSDDDNGLMALVDVP